MVFESVDASALPEGSEPTDILRAPPGSFLLASTNLSDGSTHPCIWYSVPEHGMPDGEAALRMALLVPPGGDMPSPPRGHTFWHWDGNREAPTLTPSIGCHPSANASAAPGSKYSWHGHLTAGRFEACE